MILTAVLVLFAIPWQVPDSQSLAVSFQVKRGSKAKIWESKSVSPRFGSDSPVAQIATAETADQVKSQLARFMEAAREFESENRTPVAILNHETGPIVSIAMRDFVSLYLSTYEYTGGAHPNRHYIGMTWGMVDGKARRLRFADLLKEGEDASAVASKVVVPKLISVGASWFKSGEKIALETAQADNFVVTKAGITWLFSPYDAGPYVEGEFFIKVPWSELKGHLRDRRPEQILIGSDVPRSPIVGAGGARLAAIETSEPPNVAVRQP